MDNPVIFGFIIFVLLVGAVASIVTLFFTSREKGTSGKGDVSGRRAAKRVYFQITVSKDPKFTGIADNLKNFLQNFAIPAIKAHAKSAAGRLREADLVCLELVTGNVAPAKADILIVLKLKYKEKEVYLQINPLDKRANSREIDVSVPTEIGVAGTSMDALKQEQVMSRIIAILTDAVKGKPVSSLGDVKKKAR